MIARPTIQATLFVLFLAQVTAYCQQTAVPAPSVEGIKGVNQRSAASVKNVEPPAAKPVAPPPAAAPEVKQVDGAAAQSVNVPAAPATASVTAEKMRGVKPPPPPNSVKSVAPPPESHAVGAIHAVKGVQGIVVPKQRNLEAALLIKESTKGSDQKARAAAASLFRPQGKEAGAQKMEDDRAVFQEFAQKLLPGS